MAMKWIAFSAVIGVLPITICAAPPPSKVGQCADTTIRQIGTRLEGIADSGDAVSYANGGYQVDYGTIKGLKDSRAGDPVKLCLTSLPENCPPSDDRGKSYKATNLRTHQSWNAFDSEHMCGGA
jgi:hypothetical protein